MYVRKEKLRQNNTSYVTEAYNHSKKGLAWEDIN